MSIFDNFNSNKAYQEIKNEEINKVIIDENAEVDETYKGKLASIPAYKLFEKRFKIENPDSTEEDLNFVFKKRKGVYYINFNKIANNSYIMPDGNCKGITLLEHRKINFKDITQYVKVGNRYHKVYENLNCTPIGVIPINHGDYILIAKRIDSLNNIILAVISIFLLLKIFIM